MSDRFPPRERTLDPDDWNEFRALAHRMVNDMIDHLATLRERPAWRPMPDTVRASFGGPVPLEGEGAEAAYREFVERVLPYPNGNLHPRFWGWVQGTGTPLAALVEAHPDLELLAPVPLNVVCFRYAPSGLREERRNAVNEEILLRIQEEGIAVPSGTVLAGRYAIRVANVNHRSRREDFVLLVSAVARIGAEVAGVDPG